MTQAEATTETEALIELALACSVAVTATLIPLTATLSFAERRNVGTYALSRALAIAVVHGLGGRAPDRGEYAQFLKAFVMHCEIVAEGEASQHVTH